jgi:tripartite-type tricarboxylate transporter receptor subunit TctC
MRHLLLAGLAALTLSGPALAQDRTVRVISGFAAGGAGDLMARFIAEYAAPHLPARGVVENRTGANGLIAAELVARSAPDGATVLQCPMGTMTITPNLPGASLPVDPRTEMTGIVNVALSTYGLVVAANGPHKDVAGLLAAARAKPGGLTYASAGVGSAQHLSVELLKAKAGLDIVHVPYRGSAPAIAALLAGDLDLLFDASATSAPHILQGSIKGLAITMDRRIGSLPNTPTLQEEGVAGYHLSVWNGVFTQSRVPAPILARLQDAFHKAMDAAMLDKLKANHTEPLPIPSKELQPWLDRDAERWGQVARDSGIKID